jgi:von Willebrand factor type A domain
MGRHVARRAGRIPVYWWVVAIVLAVAGVAFGLAATSQSDHPVASSSGTGSSSGVSGPCSRQLRVVTATSYEPVLQKAADGIAQGPDCVKVTTTRADGSGAADVVASSGADAWIADDASWPQLPSTAHIGKDRAQVVATSPLYVVTQRSAAALPPSAQTWVGLGQLLGQPKQSQLVVSDPTASGAGMVAVGALAGAVLVKAGPLVSALDMMRAWQSGTTVNAAQLAVPKTATQIAVLPEYALLASGHASDYRVFAPRDAAALMRFSLLPTDAAAADPVKNAAISRLGRALTGQTARTAVSAAGLRGPTWPATPPPAATDAGLPSVPATAMPIMIEHLMYHVLSTWHPELRRTNMLIVVDVSGSMSDQLPGAGATKIDLVRQGINQVNSLLPSDAQLGLWQFGSQLAPPNDWQPLTAIAPLNTSQRNAVQTAATNLAARPVGTGLYDTILAAYRYQQAHYVPGLPNQVIVFTDGVNEDDPVTISIDQLKAGLAAAGKQKYVQLSVFGFGASIPADSLSSAVSPVDGQVDELTNTDQVIGAFVHAVSGALSGTTH